MTSKPKRKPVDEHEIDDARLEYELLVKAIENLANMLWVGYGAFFALNTLIATAYGSTFTVTNPEDGVFKALRIWLPIIGIAISVVAIYASHEIIGLRNRAFERGLELEDLVHARVFYCLKSHHGRRPIATIIGSLLFLGLWAICFVYAIS